MLMRVSVVPSQGEGSRPCCWPRGQGPRVRVERKPSTAAVKSASLDKGGEAFSSGASAKRERPETPPQFPSTSIGKLAVAAANSEIMEEGQ
jgi:hypothetical protein